MDIIRIAYYIHGLSGDEIHCCFFMCHSTMALILHGIALAGISTRVLNLLTVLINDVYVMT